MFHGEIILKIGQNSATLRVRVGWRIFDCQWLMAPWFITDRSRCCCCCCDAGPVSWQQGPHHHHHHCYRGTMPPLAVYSSRWHMPRSLVRHHVARSEIYLTSAHTHTHTHTLVYTVSQKKVPTFKLSLTLSNINRFAKFLRCWKAYEICYKIVRHYHLILGVLLRYLGKLKIQIFWRYSANME